MDYLYIGNTEGSEFKYLLLLREDFSSFIWLWPAEKANGENAADALAGWVPSFGAVDWIVTDQGTHFKNTLVKSLTKNLNASHHFTTACCPWANGSIERICREVIRACRALLSEMKLSPLKWPAISESVQCILNQAPLRRSGARKNEPGIYRTPLEVFTGHRPMRSLIRALPIHEYKNVDTIDSARAIQLV